MRRLVRDAVSPAGEREKKEDAGKTCASQRVTPVPPFILQKKKEIAGHYHHLLYHY